MTVVFENTIRSGVFLTNIEVLGNVVEYRLERFIYNYIFSIETKTKEKTNK